MYKGIIICSKWYAMLFFTTLCTNVFSQQAFYKQFSQNQDRFEQIAIEKPFALLTEQKEIQEFKKAAFLSVNDFSIRESSDKNQALKKLTLPLNEHSDLILLLEKQNIYDDLKIKMASGAAPPDISDNEYYWGIVEGEENSMVSLTISNDEVFGIISFKGRKFNLGKVQNESYYVMYESSDLHNSPVKGCGVHDEHELFPTDQQIPDDLEKDANNCVNLYVEVDNDIYSNKGSGTADFITAMFAQVSLLYANESINLNLGELIIWDTADPYSGPSTGDYLSQFRNRIGSNFNGDIAHLVGYRGSGGIAYLNTLCYKNYSHGYSDVNSSFNDVPTYSWTIEVLAHEIGHNLGSKHTHACAWNGNNTPLDDCGNVWATNSNSTAEGSNCYDATNPMVPSAGTVMSYCHLISGVGIDFNLGFGQQPGDLLRSKVYNSPCLTSCSSDCEVGSTCNDYDECTTNDMIDSNCNCVGTFMDGDNDGVCDLNDACPGFDDQVDNDNDGIPDGCDDCTNGSISFSVPQLTHQGPGSSASVANLDFLSEGVNFTIDNINQRINGNPNNRFIERVTVLYVDGNGDVVEYGIFLGSEQSTVQVMINGFVSSVTVRLDDVLDGNAGSSMSINLSQVNYCPTNECPDNDGDGVCDKDDVCPQGDDNIDLNNNGIPDDCESNCVPEVASFSNSNLTHTGVGESSSTFVFQSAGDQNASFSITGMDSKLNGNPSLRYNDKIEVQYIDGNGNLMLYGIFAGSNMEAVNVMIEGQVQEVIVILSDGYDGDAGSRELSVLLSDIEYCNEPFEMIGNEPDILNTNMEVYPNPFNEELTVEISSPHANEGVYNIYDLSGKAISKHEYFEGSKILISSKSFNHPGIYILEIELSSGMILREKVLFVR